MAACGQTSSGGSDEGTKDSQRINVMFVCDEWKSSKGGLSTFNRELAVNLVGAASEKLKVYCYVSQSDDQDREDARKSGVTLLTAQKLPGTSNRHDWLKIPPPELPYPDIVIGHGRKFGQPAYFIKRMTNSQWVQILHVFCEDLGKHKSSKELEDHPAVDTIQEYEEKHEHELELCEVADAVVAVGPGLQQKYRSCLPDTKVEVITPGVTDSFSVNQLPQWQLDEEEVFRIGVFGRAAHEDLFLKGYDIIADAIGNLGGKFKMTFFGSPSGEQRKLEKWFLKKTKISRDQLTIHSYVDQGQMKRKFRESNMFVLPSREEAFGLVALEAISAGVPVLVSEKAGIAKVLQKVEGGNSVIITPNNPEEWARRIHQLSQQTPEERHATALHLRQNYKKTYSWETECQKFSALIENLKDEAAEGRPVPMANKENINRGSEDNINSNQQVVQGNRKRPRTKADAKLQHFIPAVLEAALWRFLGKIFGNRSLIESRGLKWGDIFLQKDSKTCKERLVLKGGDSKSHQGQGELENEALQSAAVRYYKAFESHRPHEMCQPGSPFYLAVKYKRKDGDPVWYMKKPQGVNKIGKMPQTKARNKCPRL